MKRIRWLAPFCSFVLFSSGVVLSAPEPANPEQVVAVVNGKKITLAEVESKAGMRLHQLELRVFQLKQAMLDSLIRELLFEQEAKAQGISVGEYKRSLLLGAEVSEAEVEDIVRKMYGAEGANNPVFREQVRVRLERNKKEEVIRARGEELRKAARVEVFLSAPAPPTVQVEAGDRKGWGNANAPVTLIEFADFQCEHCSAAAPVVREILGDYGDRVRYLYRHFPLPHHGYSRMAAEASECARAEGKFWEYHDLLFANRQFFSGTKLVELAGAVNLDPRAFERCLVVQRYRGLVEEDFREGQRLGVAATPTFFINGKRFQGTPTAQQLRELIDAELSRTYSGPARQEER